MNQDMLERGVFFIESPRVGDLLSGRSEGDVSAAVLKSFQVPNIARVVSDIAEFKKAIDLFCRLHDEDAKGFGVLIISAHGCEDGIYLTDGSLVRWEQLFGYLEPAGTDFVLLLSACDVMKGRLVRHLEDRSNCPHVVIGYEGEVDWARSALASAIIIHGLANQDLPSWWNALSFIGQYLRLPIAAYSKSGSSKSAMTGKWTGRTMKFAHDKDIDTVLGKDTLASKSTLVDFVSLLRVSADPKLQKRVSELYKEAITNN